jgi:hypothetical protein
MRGGREDAAEFAPKVPHRRSAGTGRARPRHLRRNLANDVTRGEQLADRPRVEIALRFPLEQFAQDLGLIRSDGPG